MLIFWSKNEATNKARKYRYALYQCLGTPGSAVPPTNTTSYTKLKINQTHEQSTTNNPVGQEYNKSCHHNHYPTYQHDVWPTLPCTPKHNNSTQYPPRPCLCLSFIIYLQHTEKQVKNKHLPRPAEYQQTMVTINDDFNYSCQTGHTTCSGSGILIF